MISVLAQERLLGATLGGAITGIIVFEQRKCIYKSISDNQPEVAPKFQRRELLSTKKTSAELAQLWNKAVDQTFGPLIEYIGSRRW